MWVRVLGAGAGGGFPQWNCACPGCRAVRDGSRPATPRTQSSIAVSADRRRWYLVNASPDLRAQIEACAELRPRTARDTPIAAVLLTDAELDHTMGLLLLREGPGVELHATPATVETLVEGTGLLPTLERYTAVDRREVVPGTTVTLDDHLTSRAFDVPTAKHARFGGTVEEGRVVGYRFTDTRSGRSVVYLPGVQTVTPEVRAELGDAAVVLVDGTCWHDDELVRLGLGRRTAHDMGHLAMAGPGGSLELLAGLPAARRIYVHVNNTNPVLLDDSPERAEVTAAGVEIATDGLEVEV